MRATFAKWKDMPQQARQQQVEFGKWKWSAEIVRVLLAVTYTYAFCAARFPLPAL
jgi:hypothetical protein